MGDKAKVLATRKLPGGVEALRGEVDLEENPYSAALDKEKLIERIEDKDAVICFLNDTIDAQVMESAPHLKVISNCAAGVDNIDVAEASKRGIAVTNTPDVLTETTADLAWAMLMAVARRVIEADTYARKEEWQGWDPTLLLGSDVWGKVLGIVGLGRIGAAVAKRAIGFDMEVMYYSRTRKHQLEETLGAKHASLRQLLEKSDFVSLHVPLSSETRHLIGENELNLMKGSAFLINTCRGPVVDEHALVKAIYGGKIAGAALDVYEWEPIIPSALKGCNNVVLLPHIGSASVATRKQMAVMATQNLLTLLSGGIPRNLVNPEALHR